MSLENQITDNLIKEVRLRLMDESVPRLKKCLDQLTEKEIWHRPNKNTVSVGNLVLHLCGNARQWIVSSLGGYKDTRNRQVEFDEQGPIPKKELLKKVDQVMTEIGKVLDVITPKILTINKDVQGFEATGVSILMHVVEHFSYHVGQITYYVKSNKDVDMKYYAGTRLDRSN